VEISTNDQHDPKIQEVLRSFGVRLFYHVIGKVDDQSSHFPASRIAHKEIIDNLGHVLIYLFISI